MHEVPELKNTKSLWVVTGASGFIGLHIVETLLRHEQYVIGLDNFFSGNRSGFYAFCDTLPAEARQRLTFVEGDIRNSALLCDIMRGADYVLHQAALASVQLSLEQPDSCHDINVNGFFNVLKAAQQAKIKKIVYASSSAVYGDDDREEKIEAFVGAPLSPYALSKHMNEEYAQLFASCYEMPSVGLRYFNVFGPRQAPDSPYSAVIPLWIKAMYDGEPVYINGTGETTRDFVFIADVVRVNILSALSTAMPKCAIMNVGSGISTNLKQLFYHINSSIAHHGVESVQNHPLHRDFRNGDILFSKANIDRIAHYFPGITMQSMQDGIIRTASWYLSQWAER